MKNILLITPSLAPGGQEMVAIKTAKLLSSLYQVYMYVLSPHSNELDTDDILVFRSNKILKHSSHFSVINYIINYINIKRYKSKLNIDVAISIAPAANLLNILTKKNEKVITSLRGVKSLYSFTGSIKVVQRKTDKLFCVSKDLMNKAQKYYGLKKDKIDYLYNPYNLNEILEKGKENIENEYIHSNTIISVGRIEPIKGYEHLIRAYAVVAQEIPNSQLLVVGEGSKLPELKLLCKKLKINDKVHFVGYRKNPYKYLANSKVFVLTSENEGFPNALVEAMALTAVISVDCETGPREILCSTLREEEITDISYEAFGILTRPIEVTRDYAKTELEKSEEFLAKAIIQILNDENMAKYYKDFAQKRVRDFSEKEYIERLTSMIEERG